MNEFYDDLYALLEVSPYATQEEIKKAYYAAARKYHPDVCHAPDSQQKFQKINAAYDILKDPRQRARYDSFISYINMRRSGSPFHSGTEPGFQDFYIDPSDIYNIFFTELDLALLASLFLNFSFMFLWPFFLWKNAMDRRSFFLNIMNKK